MPGGVRVEGLCGLRSLLLGEHEQFAATVTEKLLAYALGRALDYRDRPTVRGSCVTPGTTIQMVLADPRRRRDPAFRMRRSGTDIKRSAR